MTVLVTGGAGFIGSHLVDRLVERGEFVRVVDNLDPLAHPDGPPAHLNPDAQYVWGDLRDPSATARALDGVDLVFHLGGVVGNGESMVNVRRAVDANTAGTATLLEGVIARRDLIRRVVVASSMVVYGEGAYACAAHGSVEPASRSAEQLKRRDWAMRCPRCGEPLAPEPTAEHQALRPTSVYGITKRDQEELCLTLARAYGFEAVALRYLNTYGPRQALGNPYTGVAAIFASRILGGKRAQVFEDGAQLRDLTHVSDTVGATIMAMEAPAASGHAINVATGRPTRVVDLATGISERLGSATPPEITGRYRAGDIRHCFADVELGRELLGFTAATALDDGLDDLTEWLSGRIVEDRGDEAARLLQSAGLVS